MSDVQLQVINYGFLVMFHGSVQGIIMMTGFLEAANAAKVWGLLAIRVPRPTCMMFGFVFVHR